MVVIGGLAFGAIYALAAIGIVVIHKATKTVNFAHGGFVLLGAFAAYLVVVHFKLSYWAAYLVVPLVIGVLAMAVELTILRPLRRADMFTVITATIFVGIGLSEAYRLSYNTEILALPNPVPGAPFFLGDVILTREQLLGGRDVSALDRSIDLRISRLRRRFEENPQHAKLIKTVYGAGYLLAATVTWS